MTICPIAIAVGCEKCPAFSFCPLTTVLGDQQKKDEIEWSAGSTNTAVDKKEDEYQRYAE